MDISDLHSLDFQFLETSEDKLEHRISIKLSDSFSTTNSISLLYWKVDEDQSWIGLTRDNDTGFFINESETN